MKTLTLFFCILSLSSLAQNFQPFNENVPKRFVNANDPTDDDYFFYTDSTKVQGDSLIFRQYLISNYNKPAVEHPDCIGWGGNGIHTGDTSWLGRVLIMDTVSSTLTLNNEMSQQLFFDFGLPLGDSSLFYQNATDNFYIVYTSLQQETFFGQAGSTKTFVIRHYDNLSQPVSSNLHNFEIKLGEQLGLLQFINGNQFPTIEQGLTMRGQLNPTLGQYQMTYDEIYTWDVGDLIQYSTYESVQAGYPGTVNYQMMEITNRVETTDSVYIYFQSDFFNFSTGPTSSCPGFFSTNSPISFRKGENILEYPHNGLPYESFYFFEDSTTSCGGTARLSFSEEFSEYCDSCECMIAYDGFGDYKESRAYDAGRGWVSQSFNGYGPPNLVGFCSKSMNYSNIGGVECGTAHYLGLDELQLTIELHPNPASEQITVKSNSIPRSIYVHTLDGKLKQSVLNLDLESTLDIHGYASGIYIVTIETENASTSKRIIVQ